MNQLGMGVTEWTSVLSDCAVIFASIATVYIGWTGLSAWKKQIVGARRIALAEETMLIIHQVANIIQRARFGMAFGPEGQTWPGREHEPNDLIRDQKDGVYAPMERLFRHQDKLEKMELIRDKCIVVFDDPHLIEVFNEFRGIVGEMRVATNMLFENIQNMNRPGYGESDQINAEMKKDKAVIWCIPSNTNPDPIQKRLDEAVDKARTVLALHLR